MTQLGVGYTVTRGYEEDCPVDPFKVMYLAVGAYDYSEEEISKIYNLSLPYFEQAQIRKQRSGVLYHDHQAYEGFDVTTLKGTLVSEKGIQPESYGYQAASYKLDKSKLFEYDDLRKIHVYGSYEDNVKDLGTNKAKLVYDFNLKNEGTISLRFKPKMLTSDLRTILSLQKGTETPLGLYVNSVNQLCLTLGQFESLSVPVNHDAWNHLVISWSGSSLWIYLNNNQMIPKTKSVSFDQCKLSIGSLINNLEPTYHFNGQFEMLAYSDQVVDSTKVSQLRTSYQTVSVESVYDYLGRKEKEEIKVGTQVLESNMTYKSPGVGKTSMQVENFETYTGENITYVYDDLGNVIHMDTADGIYDYEYDYMGRLILEYNPVLDQTIKIEYNKQNIAYKRYYVGKTTTIDKEMEFLTNSENQLLFVDTIKDANVVSLPLSYPSSYLGNPTMIGSKTLSWEGRKLIAIPSDNVSYTYNEQSIRTKKIVDGVETKYHLKGSNIIAETKDSVTTFFIYNEQDELVGFEYNNNHYFYVRDLLGKITEVIDKNGTVMVSYKYDAWGKWINKDTASNGTTLGDTLVTVNPFIYKGYYYDSETDWYYLKSRYYCPVLSRFINLDNTNYLEPGSIDGVNLFAYCGNDPVMGYDPNGNFSFKKLWSKVKGTIKKAVNKVVDYFLEKTDIKFDYGFGFIENQIRTGGIDKIWDASWKNGEGTVTMWSPLNLFGIDSTINLSFGLTSDKGLYFGVGHSMETGEGVVTTTWGHRVVPYAFATVAIKTYNYVKEKVQNIDWNVIGRVAKGVAIVALIAVGAWAVITFAPGLLPIVAKLAVPALASFIVYLNL